MRIFSAFAALLAAVQGVAAAGEYEAHLMWSLACRWECPVCRNINRDMAGNPEELCKVDDTNRNADTTPCCQMFDDSCMGCGHKRPKHRSLRIPTRECALDGNQNPLLATRCMHCRKRLTRNKQCAQHRPCDNDCQLVNVCEQKTVETEPAKNDDNGNCGDIVQPPCNCVSGAKLQAISA